MDVIGMKVFAGFLFFFLVFFFGWIPFWCIWRCSKRSATPRFTPSSTRERSKSRIVMFLHSMASGVLLATCLLSLLPEAIEALHLALGSSRTLLGKRETMTHQGTETNTTSLTNVTDSQQVFVSREQILKSKNDEEETDRAFYPLAELLIALGFLAIYIVDSLVRSLKGPKTSHKLSTRDNANEIVLFERPKRRAFSDQMNESDAEDNNFVEKPSAKAELGSPSFAFQSVKRAQTLKPRFSHDFEPLIEDEETPSEYAVSIQTQDPLSDRSAKENHPIADRPEVGSSQLETRSAALRSVALVSALCIHGFFDGVLLGLQTSAKVLLSLLFALSVHKTFVSLSLSLTLYNSHGRDLRLRRAFLYFLSFASVAPLGLAMSAGFVHRAIGMSESGEVSLIPGSLQAFAVGTFMYVTFTETTGHSKGNSLLLQTVNHVFLLAGFSIMAGLRAALGEV